MLEPVLTTLSAGALGAYSFEAAYQATLLKTCSANFGVCENTENASRSLDLLAQAKAWLFNRCSSKDMLISSTKLGAELDTRRTRPPAHLLAQPPGELNSEDRLRLFVYQR